jgi:SAM-dependent methyltransferase
MTGAQQPDRGHHTQDHGIHAGQTEHTGHTGPAGQTASADGPGHITHGHRTHHFDPSHAERLVGEERHQRMPPEPILRAAGVAPGQTVVDLGAGPGFFTLPAARLVGDAGRVYAVDVQAPLLEICLRRAKEAGLSGIETVHSQETHIPLPDAIADRVLIFAVLHEADDQTALLREAARLLRPAGEVVILDWHKIEGTPGPPLDHRIGQDELTTLAAPLGLHPLPTPPISEDYYLVHLTQNSATPA